MDRKVKPFLIISMHHIHSNMTFESSNFHQPSIFFLLPSVTDDKSDKLGTMNNYTRSIIFRIPCLSIDINYPIPDSFHFIRQ